MCIVYACLGAQTSVTCITVVMVMAACLSSSVQNDSKWGCVFWLQCEGVGKDSIPGAIDFDVVDDMMQVTDKQSFTVCNSS